MKARSLVSPRFASFMAMGMAVFSAGADEIHLNLLPAGATAKIGVYRPQRLKLSSEKPASIKQLPADLTAPLFGVLKLGPVESPTLFTIIVDEPEGKPSRLFVDANANGDLADDPPAVWAPQTYKTKEGLEFARYSGGAELSVAYGTTTARLHLAMYRFDKKDPGRAPLKDFLLYYSDYAREGEITLGEKAYKTMLVDGSASGDFRGQKGEPNPTVQLLVDLNGDGKFNPRAEAFDVLKPFNVGGTTYELSGLTASGDSFKIDKSTQSVPEAVAPPSLEVGKKAAEFKAKIATDLNFPSGYKGKLVILDFWATWCGPCIAEMPNLVAAYEKFHSQGLEVIGISLDQAGADEKVDAFTKEKKMTWPQVYDGKFWESTVAKLYGVHSIPNAFLVDGDTGMILAVRDALHGDALEQTLREALAKKNAK